MSSSTYVGTSSLRPSTYVHHSSTYRNSTYSNSSSSSSSNTYSSNSYLNRTSPRIGTGGSGTGITSSSHLRSTSLDRSLSFETPSSSSSSSTSSSLYHHHSLVTPSTLRPLTSRPPRISSYANTSGGSAYLLERSKKQDLTLTPLSRISYLRSNSMKGRSVPSRTTGCDALHDCVSSPVLTNYRRLGDIGTSSRRSSQWDSAARLELALSGTNLVSSSRDSVYGSSTNLRGDSDSGVSSSSSGSSSPSLSTGRTSSKNKLDENYNNNDNNNLNYLPPRYKYDSNHNLCSSSSSSFKGSDEEGEGTKNGSGESSSASSSSSSSPASTLTSRRLSRYASIDDDVASTYSSYGRRRRTSGQASTSGYSSDASNSSGGGGGGSSPGSNVFRKEKHDNGGIIGLRNLGNTCFMNCVIQCLSNTRPLLEYCLKESYTSDINYSTSSMKGGLIRAFSSLLQSLWKPNPGESSVNPQAFKSQIQKFAPRFTGYSQQDAQEFLRYLLQGLHEDVNRVTTKPTSLTNDIDDNLSNNQKATESWRRYLRLDDSKIVDLFVGQLKSTLRCTVCGHTSVTFDPFWDLSLPIPKSGYSVKLSHCFDLFTREEVLDGDEKPTCSKCKTRRKCTKSFTVQKFPKILVIHLKRFSPSEKYKSKLTSTVDFPLLNLDLGSYATNGSRGQNCVYNLYGVSNHSGTVYTGHYTAYCKHPYSGEWHDFNDSRATKVSNSSIASSEAYVLFYEQASQSSRL